MRYSAVGCIVTLTLSLLVAPRMTEAQPPAKSPLIGYLRSSSAADAAQYGEALRQGLRDLGYVEGRNIMIETRAAEGHHELLPGLAAELVRLPVDVIVAGGTPAVRATKDATSTIPIVMAVSTDPVGAGLVVSLAQPGGNVTGVSLGTGEQFAGKWVELLKEAVPQVSRVAVLVDPTIGPPLVPIICETKAAARVLGLELHLLEARDPPEIERAFAAMGRADVEALLVLPSPRFNAARARIVELAATHRLPAMYEHREFVDIGGFMSYGPNLRALARRAAYYVDQLLHGTQPADLPVEQPARFELVINLQTANALGLVLSPGFLFQADEVIK
jgi:putative ABC transport system substrate-binding protein